MALVGSPEPRQIDWSSAQVADGTLEVGLTGKASKDWRRRFEAVVELLGRGHGEWGEVGLTRQGITVAELREGAEGDLHHFLESAVLQANSEQGPDGPANGGDALAEHDPEAQAEDRMTATFRSFAEDAG